MSASKLPSQVSLPEIPRYSDDIVFGALDFPVGFDQSSLIVNLRLIDRIRLAGGLRNVTVYASNSENEPYDIDVSSVDEQGTATIGVVGKRSKKPISHSLLHYDKGGSLTTSPEVTIRVDNSEIEKRIEESDKYPRGVFDTVARAKFLNKAVKQGLVDASFNASFSIARGILSGITYPMGIGELYLAGINSSGFGIVENTTLLTFLAHAGFSGSWAYSNSSCREEFLARLKDYRYSLGYGLTPDRFLAASALLTGRSVVRART
jgi:hypothetical protein